MKRVELGSEAGRDRVLLALARSFLDALAGGHLVRARDRVAEGFSWFGREIAPDQWQGQTLGAFVSAERMTFSNLRTVPRDVIDGLFGDQAGPLFGGVLAPEDRVVLVDVQRATADVTMALVVGARAGADAVIRVVDPTPFKDAVERGATH